MAKDREVQCEYYIYEGHCSKGHDGIFKKTCQKCKDYHMKKGAKPRRKNLKQEKNIKWLKDVRNFF